MNISVRTLESLLSILQSIYPQVEELDIYSNSVFNFLRKHRCFLQQLYHFIFLPAMHKGSNFSIYLQTHIIFWFFLNKGHPNGSEVMVHCDFDLYFTNEY